MAEGPLGQVAGGRAELHPEQDRPHRAGDLAEHLLEPGPPGAAEVAEGVGQATRFAGAGRGRRLVGGDIFSMSGRHDSMAAMAQAPRPTAVKRTGCSPLPSARPVASTTWSSATRASSSSAMRRIGSTLGSGAPSVATPWAMARAASSQGVPPCPTAIILSRSLRKGGMELPGSFMATTACYGEEASVTSTDRKAPWRYTWQGVGAGSQHVDTGAQLGH